MAGWKPFFIWKNKSSKEMGIEVLKLPNLIFPEENVEKINIPGRSGSLHYLDGTFNQIELNIEFAVLNLKNIDNIASWLTGSSDLIISKLPDKKYKGVIVNKIPLEQVIRQIHKGTAYFSCQPFKYSREPFKDKLELNKPVNFPGKGTVNSMPLITVFGSGDILVNINGQEIRLENISESITLNAEIMCAYKGEESQDNKMSGSFPLLLPQGQTNIINWSGNVEKIEIQPNWAWR